MNDLGDLQGAWATYRDARLNLLGGIGIRLELMLARQQAADRRQPESEHAQHQKKQHQR